MSIPPVRRDFGSDTVTTTPEQVVLDLSAIGDYHPAPDDLERAGVALFDQLATEQDLLPLLQENALVLTITTRDDAVEDSIIKAIADQLTAVMHGHDVQLIEAETVAQAMDELQLTADPLVDPEALRAINAHLGSDFVVVCDVIDRDRMLTLNIRIMDASTGLLLVADRDLVWKVVIPEGSEPELPEGDLTSRETPLRPRESSKTSLLA